MNRPPTDLRSTKALQRMTHTATEIRWLMIIACAIRANEQPAAPQGAIPEGKETEKITSSGRVRCSRLGLIWANGVWVGCCLQVKWVLTTLSGGCGSGCAGWLSWLVSGAGVGVEGGGAEGFELGEQFVQPAVVVDPGGDLPRAFRTADLWLIHAADCCSRYSSWTCRGVRY